MSAETMFLPEPVPRDVKFTVISVDDHLVEPRHMFEGRLPNRHPSGHREELAASPGRGAAHDL
jgi:hypothetical protein